eukprot:TRINITY_DN100618_c0_g1_i1.p1 TRINITY_DN100618_c0_g1~~TRINITY_DN100618_c0_g1_i1.p1  ORF type:complete len:1088 (-),score=318.58 TRINITY_DN100618_c0_g1_i1:85-3348(-)
MTGVVDQTVHRKMEFSVTSTALSDDLSVCQRSERWEERLAALEATVARVQLTGDGLRSDALRELEQQFFAKLCEETSARKDDLREAARLQKLARQEQLEHVQKLLANEKATRQAHESMMQSSLGELNSKFLGHAADSLQKCQSLLDEQRAAFRSVQQEHERSAREQLCQLEARLQDRLGEQADAWRRLLDEQTDGFRHHMQAEANAAAVQLDGELRALEEKLEQSVQPALLSGLQQAVAGLQEIAGRERSARAAHEEKMANVLTRQFGDAWEDGGQRTLQEVLHSLEHELRGDLANTSSRTRAETCDLRASLAGESSARQEQLDAVQESVLALQASVAALRDAKQADCKEVESLQKQQLLSVGERLAEVEERLDRGVSEQSERAERERATLRERQDRIREEVHGVSAAMESEMAKLAAAQVRLREDVDGHLPALRLEVENISRLCQHTQNTCELRIEEVLGQLRSGQEDSLAARDEALGKQLERHQAKFTVHLQEHLSSHHNMLSDYHSKTDQKLDRSAERLDSLEGLVEALERAHEAALRERQAQGGQLEALQANLQRVVSAPPPTSDGGGNHHLDLASLADIESSIERKWQAQASDLRDEVARLGAAAAEHSDTLRDHVALTKSQFQLMEQQARASPLAAAEQVSQASSSDAPEVRQLSRKLDGVNQRLDAHEETLVAMHGTLSTMSAKRQSESERLWHAIDTHTHDITGNTVCSSAAAAASRTSEATSQVASRSGTPQPQRRTATSAPQSNAAAIQQSGFTVAPLRPPPGPSDARSASHVQLLAPGTAAAAAPQTPCFSQRTVAATTRQISAASATEISSAASSCDMSANGSLVLQPGTATARSTAPVSIFSMRGSTTPAASSTPPAPLPALLQSPSAAGRGATSLSAASLPSGATEVVSLGQAQHPSPQQQRGAGGSFSAPVATTVPTATSSVATGGGICRSCSKLGGRAMTAAAATAAEGGNGALTPRSATPHERRPVAVAAPVPWPNAGGAAAGVATFGSAEYFASAASAPGSLSVPLLHAGETALHRPPPQQPVACGRALYSQRRGPAVGGEAAALEDRGIGGVYRSVSANLWPSLPATE